MEKGNGVKPRSYNNYKAKELYGVYITFNQQNQNRLIYQLEQIDKIYDRKDSYLKLLLRFISFIKQN